MILSIINSLDSALEYGSIVFLLGLAFHAGVIHNRVNKLEHFVESQLPAIFNDVKEQVNKLEGKIDKLTTMFYEHQVKGSGRLES